MYVHQMRFAWDPEKSERTLRERDYDFAMVRFAELRSVTDAISVTVVYTDRAEAAEVVRRVISARVRNRRERQAYRKIFPIG